MAFAGEKFFVDFEDDEIDVNKAPPDDSPIPSLGLIGEIQERTPSAAPPAPKPPSGTGFPQHRRRTNQSSFKQRRAQKQQQQQTSTPASAPASTSAHDDKASINEQNRRQLDSMSASQIQKEREELMSTLDPSLLERFLRRANIDDEQKQDPPELSDKPGPQDEKPTKSVSFDIPEPEPPSTPKPPPTSTPASTVPPPPNEDLPPSQLPTDLHPASESPLPNTVHFPTPPYHTNTAPNLNPSSPSFLSDLQTHYFPEITHDPSALSWLQPSSSSSEDPDANSAYHPASSADAVHTASIRFSLIGTLLSPSTSLALPTNLGLHHHGNDPQAAGYTIPELAILTRSSFPAQRCIAYQVLGRILFRLGKGQFGERGSTLVEGLWSVIEKEGVVSRMLAEADGAQTQKKDNGNEQPTAGAGAGGVGRHASASAWAVEGVWLWQMSGAGDRGVLKEGAVRSQ